MASSTARTLFDRFDQTAVAVVQARPEADPTMIKEIFEEAATLLHNGIALDHLDDHDADIVIAGLCIALSDADVTTALLTLFYAATDEPDGLHDPAGAALAYENVLRILQL
ncbi:hypothetical protein GCM10009867_20960 [Pedococcus aerophilus]|uniref:Uncharacterized protein n=1 Tax=Pedococcus aerophilus TaxID=436356 RepID=A0ABN3UPH6_9MICO